MSSITTYDASVTATTELLAKGCVLINSVEVENPNTSVVYLQLFDAALTTDVTLGSTAPTTTRLIPAGDGTNNGVRILDFTDPLRFEVGVVYAITTTRSGSTAPSSVCQINFSRS